MPKKLQKSKKPEEKQQALVLHLKYGGLIIQQILGKLGYQREKINQIVDIVMSHKFQDPTELDKRLLIDADAVADALPDQFQSDLKSYKVTTQQLYNFRKKNDFYTASAKEIFVRELEQRKKEYNLQ